MVTKKIFLKKEASFFLTAGLFIILGVILIWRAFHGMDTTDETFYFATAKRFCEGDMLFKDDWNRGQIYGLLMVPFYKMHVFLNGNNEGIILTARILFVLISLAIAFFLYISLKEYDVSRGASFLASICVLFYARGNIITMSYYSLGFYTFLLAVLFWMLADRSGRRRYRIISGISFSISVLCMPYMAVGFVVMWIYVGYRAGKGHKITFIKAEYFSFGCIVSAAIFLIYYFKMIPWRQLLKYVFVVFSDPGLEQEGLLYQYWALLTYIINSFLKYTWPIYIVTVIVSLLVGKKKIKNTEVKKWMTGVLIAEFLIQAIYVRGYFEGGIIAVFFLLMFQLQLLYPEYRLKEFEIYFLVPGILFAAIWVVGSNVGERVINMGVLLMDLWGLPLLWLISKEKGNGMIYKCLRIPAFVLPGILLLIRCFDVYRDGAVNTLTYQISSGVMKGIYTEPSRGMAYENAVELLEDNVEEGAVIAVLGCNPWGYLDSPALCGSYTTWQFSDGENRLIQYYVNFPDKVPDVVLVPADDINTYEYWKYSSHGVGLYEGEHLELYGILKEIVEKGNYEKTESGGTVLYKAGDLSRIQILKEGDATLVK